MFYFLLLITFIIGLTIAWLFQQSRFQSCEQIWKSQVLQLQAAQEEIKQSLTSEREKLFKLAEEKAVLITEKSHISQQLENEQKKLETTQQRLTAEFKNLANELLEEKSRRFSDHNKLQIENILKPLGEKIANFEQQVATAHRANLERGVALQTEIKKLNELNVQVTKEAENLAKAIKGDQKVQGQWGEFILESILEKSGLMKDREYFIQESFSTEEGKRYRPDVIVKLPGQKNIIIDAKASLVNYERYVYAENDIDRQSEAKKHLQSIKSHLKDLSEKNYTQAYNLHGGLDFVLMFIPIEPAFSLAIQNDLNLFNHAYEKNIVIVSPATLIATLRTIASIWKNEYQSQNVLEIARQGGNLYDKFVSFVEDLKKVGKQIELSRSTYISAARKLYEGKDNLVRKAERIKTLGANTTKALDSSLLNKAHEHSETEKKQ